MNACSRVWLLAVTAFATASGFASAAEAESRGSLLYATHCTACHTSKQHWREKKLATDWNSLEMQVRRWQAAAFLDWRDEDIQAVTRHLNDRYYRFEPTGDPVCTQAAPTTPTTRDQAPPTRFARR
jgi:mono/diheme cytochrome c family protein